MKNDGNWKISSKIDSGLVCGKLTSIAVTEFKDKYFIVITDSGKIGSMVQVIPEISGNEKLWNTKVIFGRDQPEVQAAACAMAETSNLNKPMILGLSIKDYTVAVVRELKDLLIKAIGEQPKEEEIIQR